MATTYGFSALQKTLSTGGGQQNPLTPSLSVGRVLSISLDPSKPFEMGWISVGDVVNAPGQDADQSSDNNNPQNRIAKPFYPNTKQYPLLNELVVLIQQPDAGIMSTQSSNSLYYISIINLWNHPHHNALPQNEGGTSPSNTKTYTQTTLGSTKKPSNTPPEIKLGNTFEEKANIHPLLPFEGDVIYEGRWGNSIRLGSTVPGKNPWSKSGNTGDPIFIIRNGQGIQSNEGWTYVIEEINNDNSSIYATSTQQIPISVSSNNYFSYNEGEAPIEPSSYNQSQVILNSGRLLFNSTSDHILLSSAKSINLSSISGVNVDTNNLVIQSNKIYLGSKTATEPLLLGNQTVQLLEQLLSNLQEFMNVCTVLVGVPPGVLNAPLNNAASQMALSLQSIKSNLETIKSKDNFTV